MPEFEISTTTTPLSDKECKWIAWLEKCLSNCPDRLSLAPSGDVFLTVIDQTEMDAIGLKVNGKNEKQAGLIVATIRSNIKIHSIA